MDKIGFSIGTEECSRVIIIQGALQTRYKTHQGRQERISVVEFICADGSTVPPLFLFEIEGVHVNLVTEEFPGDWHISGTSQGWTSNIHGVEWLVKCFEPNTREKVGGQPRILFCDGHDSHITGNFIDHCMDYKIRLLIMPTPRVAFAPSAGPFGVGTTQDLSRP